MLSHGRAWTGSVWSGARDCQGDRAGEHVSPGPVSVAGWMEAVLGEEAAADHLGVHWHVPACGYPAQRVVHRPGPQGHHGTHRLRQRREPAYGRHPADDDRNSAGPLADRGPQGRDVVVPVAEPPHVLQVIDPDQHHDNVRPPAASTRLGTRSRAVLEVTPLRATARQDTARPVRRAMAAPSIPASASWWQAAPTPAAVESPTTARRTAGGAPAAVPAGAAASRSPGIRRRNPRP